MAPALPVHTDKVHARLEQLEGDRAAIFGLYKKEFTYEGAAVFPLDILAMGAMKRAVSGATAFRLLIESWNMVTARTLLRTHIDTALRFSAAWLVENPHDFSTKVIAGEQINKIKDRKGKLLSDAYLVQNMSAARPWLPAVYKQLSGYVHFSGSHISASVDLLEDDGNISFRISELDTEYPEESWVEIIDCFRESTAILVHYLRGYALTKRLTPAQLAEGRELFLSSRSTS